MQPGRYPGLSMQTFQMLWGVHQQEMAAKQAHHQGEAQAAAEREKRDHEIAKQQADFAHKHAFAADEHGRNLELKLADHHSAVARERHKASYNPKRPKRAVNY